MLTPPDAVTVRTTLKAGDLGFLVHLHGIIYAGSAASIRPSRRTSPGRLRSSSGACPQPRSGYGSPSANERIVGCIAIVAASPGRRSSAGSWSIPRCRGIGLGTWLLRAAMAFCEEHSYRRVLLWTVNALAAAARLIPAAGFQLVEERPSRYWGVEVIEQRMQARSCPVDRTDRLQGVAAGDLPARSRAVLGYRAVADCRRFRNDCSWPVALPNSASISSMLGKLPFNDSGSDWTSLVCHSATPIGLAMSRKAYSAMTRSRVLQRISPIVGWSVGCFIRESTADR